MTSPAQQLADQRRELEAEAGIFASRVNYTLQEVLGYEGLLIHSVALGKRVIVTSVDSDGVALRVDGTDVYRLKVQYHCELSESMDFLAVETSSFKVFHKDVPEPIVTFDYIRKPKSSVPAAHINIHTDSDGFRRAFADSGDANRARARRKSGKEGRPGDIHFPVGGHRFRPCLEDVLQMLIDEFGVDVRRGWQGSLLEGRKIWREFQLRAAVSDYPEAAVQALEAMGFSVEWQGEGDRPGWRPHRLEAY